MSDSSDDGFFDTVAHFFVAFEREYGNNMKDAKSSGGSLSWSSAGVSVPECGEPALRLNR